MPKDYTDQTPKFTPQNMDNAPANTAPLGIFPDKEQKARISNYRYYENLFFGRHFDAFNIRVNSTDFNKAYGVLRYISVNFAGMISKICADMLFSEPVTVRLEDEKAQEYVDALWDDNNLDTQLYESALGNSHNGDALIKVRAGKRHPNDKKSSVIIEDITPSIYFPNLDPFNVRAMPLSQDLAWVIDQDKKRYLRKETHTPGLIVNKVYLMEGDKIVSEVSDSTIGLSLKPEEPTKIDRSLLIHVPNWKTGGQYFGTSDYNDLESLFFAINNRMTKTDNILDAHSDPILMVPPGILNEKGQFKKKDHRVIELGEGEDGKPEYVVWDASLENAFKEIDKLVEFVFMIGEVSPDALGMGKGGTAESGRALKYKLMRTIAKVQRKKMYYNTAIREAVLVAQQMGIAWGIEVDGIKPPAKAERPTLTFADGVPIDESEQIETEGKAIDAGIQSKKNAIMKVYGLDEAEAEEKAKEIKEDGAIEMPVANTTKDLLNAKNTPKPPIK